MSDIKPTETNNAANHRVTEVLPIHHPPELVASRILSKILQERLSELSASHLVSCLSAVRGIGCRFECCGEYVGTSVFANPIDADAIRLFY